MTGPSAVTVNWFVTSLLPAVTEIEVLDVPFTVAFVKLTISLFQKYAWNVMVCPALALGIVTEAPFLRVRSVVLSVKMSPTLLDVKTKPFVSGNNAVAEI